MHMDAIELLYRIRRVGHTQVSLARKLGVSRAVANDVIHDRSSSQRVAFYIAQVVGTDIQRLWPDRYKELPQPHHAGTHRSTKEDNRPEK
ncbi:helix-turn-helix domain-containing protein [Pollutimonas sp. H1-120]|uniref:helix-turn-helix domain-containing protein n=1 Tax=Pollutimonas sp. H1-120 TaxID=3148824 RepID=UPI003B526032